MKLQIYCLDVEYIFGEDVLIYFFNAANIGLNGPCNCAATCHLQPKCQGWTGLTVAGQHFFKRCNNIQRKLIGYNIKANIQKILIVQIQLHIIQELCGKEFVVQLHVYKKNYNINFWKGYIHRIVLLSFSFLQCMSIFLLYLFIFATLLRH